MNEGFEHYDVTMMIPFLIYKEWLLVSLQNKDRNPSTALDFFKVGLIRMQHFYEKCKCIKGSQIKKFRDLLLNL